jgi:hypothetical protein
MASVPAILTGGGVPRLRANVACEGGGVPKTQPREKVSPSSLANLIT